MSRTVVKTSVYLQTALSMFFQDGSLVQAIHACGGNPAQCKYPVKYIDIYVWRD